MRHKELAVITFVLGHLPVIAEWLVSGPPRLGENAGLLIRDFVRYEPAILEDVAVAIGIFCAAGQACEASLPFQMRGLELFADLLAIAPQATVLPFHGDIVDTVVRGLTNCGVETPLARVAYRTMSKLIRYYPAQAVSCLNTFLRDRRDQIPKCAEAEQVELLRIVADVVQKLGRSIADDVPALCEVLFPLLITFSSIIRAAGPAFGQFAEAFLTFARAGLSSGAPAVVSTTVLAIGDLCNQVAPEPSEAQMLCIHAMLGLLEGALGSRERAGRRHLPILLQGMGAVFEGMRAHLDWETVARFWTLILPLSAIEFDQQCPNDVEYRQELLAAVARAFSGSILCASSVAKRAGTDLGKNAKFVSEIKRKVWPLFNRIWDLGTLNADVAERVLELTEVLIRRLGRPVNVPLQALALRQIIHWVAVHAENEDLTRRVAAVLS